MTDQPGTQRGGTSDRVDDESKMRSGKPGKVPGMYLRFAGMIATSIVVMYFVTYLNVFSVSHIHFSEERLYMALTMGVMIQVTQGRCNRDYREGMTDLEFDA